MIKAILLGFAMLLTSSLGLAQSQDKSTFNKWDSNGNGQLSKQEFTKGARKAGWYNKWDNNGDNRIDQNEFDELGFDGDFDVWDGNNTGYLDENEVYEGVYATYDEDENGHWDAGEWDDFGEGGWFDW